MTDFSEKIINTIKEKEIKPKPHWQFLLRDYTVWSLGVFTFLIGGLAASVVIYMIKENDWEMYEQINDSLLGFIFLTLPYLWLIALALFILVADYNLRHTKKGYRYRLPMVAVFSVIASIVLGGLFYNMGVGEAIDDILSENVPYYAQTANPRMHIWCQPDAGRLAGVVVKVEDEHKFQIQDPQHLTWVILSQNARLHPSVKIEQGSTLRMVGQRSDDFMFTAERILPFGPGRAFFRSFLRNEEQRVRQHLLIHP